MTAVLDLCTPVSEDGSITRPCPVCGEAELIILHRRYDEVVVQDAEGEVVLNAQNEALTVEADYAECQCCSALMPCPVWNGRLPTPVEREKWRAWFLTQEPVT